ncbi:BamA/TamA family outer membrane protein, partial [candidate division KSB1 bacterium]|nr:BamA/TamA family outer membrane protein [candidate division KSB1 bacterium]
KAGVMQPIWGATLTPIEERFYAGGSTSIRGWSRSQLGPLGRSGEPLGGNSLFEFSQEWRFPIHGNLSGVFFFEGGNVWSLCLTLPLTDLRYAAGCGLRFSTPIGPIRLDFATPALEGSQPWQIYLSFGQAF